MNDITTKRRVRRSVTDKLKTLEARRDKLRSKAHDLDAKIAELVMAERKKAEATLAALPNAVPHTESVK